MLYQLPYLPLPHGHEKARDGEPRIDHRAVREHASFDRSPLQALYLSFEMATFGGIKREGPEDGTRAGPVDDTQLIVTSHRIGLEGPERVYWRWWHHMLLSMQ